MNRQQMEIYATVLLKKGINLQENQILVINAPVESHEFVSVLAEKAYESGASQVVLNWRSNALTRLKYDHEELASFEDFPTWRRDFSLTYYRKGAAFLSLISAAPDLLKGVDKEKLVAFQKASHTALKEYSDGMMASKVTWLVAAVPSHKWASILFPEKSPTEAYTALEEAILKASRSDGPAPLEAWDNHLNDLKKRRQWLTNKAFKALHYKNDQGARSLPSAYRNIMSGMGERRSRLKAFPLTPIFLRKKYSRPLIADKLTGLFTVRNRWSIREILLTVSHLPLRMVR